ncbi:hypothetical protein J4229_03415 [Candidatus Pacearchaeota archaeon]|nr:hypothetical protein [Candidatus Pacearchaeota archaeon]
MARKRKIIKEEAEKETEIDKKIKSYVKSYSPLAIWIGVLIAVFIIFYFAFQGIGKVEYGGITFKKVMYGNIPLYGYSYSLITQTGEIFKYNLYLRNNPKENDVKIEDKIEINRAAIVYVTINGTDLQKCNDTIIAVAQLSQFLTGNLYSIKGATPNFEDAEKTNITYADCDTFPENTVIKLEAGNETIVSRENNCYIIRAANCEILPASEKLIVEYLVGSRTS